MTVPQQLPQIPILRTRHPDFRKAIFEHQLQQKSGIRFRFLTSLALISAGSPIHNSKSSSASSRSNQRENPVASIESFCSSFVVVQFLFTILTGLFRQKRNLLKARVTIYAYYHHVRLLSPESLVVKQPQFTRVEGVGIVMQSS